MGGSESSSSGTQSTTNTSGANSPIAGSNSPIQTGNGTQFLVGGNYDASPVVVTSALGTIQRVIDDALAAVRDAGSAVRSNNDANLASQGQLLTQVLGSAQAQSAATSSGGQTEQNKTILYVVGAALAVVAAVLLFRRS